MKNTHYQIIPWLSRTCTRAIASLFIAFGSLVFSHIVVKFETSELT
ncbi:MAG: hypothetical protein M3X11_08660 [Acidobacteriota bacterium]|nr:hypothetical protein [Acidobacteriota bacterium]